MLGRLLRIFIALPIILAVWAYANTVGITATVSEATGVNIPDAMTIPGMKQTVEAREKVDEVGDKVKDRARREAVKAVRKEVRKRYGADAAALVPNDLSLKEAKNFDFKAFERLVRAQLPETKPAPKPKAPKKSTGNKYATAIKTLNSLPVKGRAPKTGYSRSQFGSEWSDSAGNFAWTGNKCDTRNDVLKRDLTNVKFDGSCKVVSGTLKHEKYTGKRDVKFIAGGPYENNLDIEHLVALGNAWQTGAQQLSAAKRAAFANDPINLLAVDPSSNRQKGDADFATWLPSNKAFRCDYAVKQIKVKKKYSLWVTKAEKSAMQGVLAKC